MFDDNNIKNIEQLIEETKVDEIRKSKSTILNDIFCYLSLFIGNEYMKKHKKNLEKKLK